MSRCDLLYNASQECDISIRDEIDNLFERYSRWGLYRKMRRTDNGSVLPCPQCRKIGTQDHSLFHICDRCLGVGYIWDEHWIKYYQWPGVGVARSRSGYKEYLPWGALPTNLAVIYVKYDIHPIEEDKVIEVEIDDIGNPLQPTIRKTMFDIRAIDDYRLDNGRHEYHRLTTMKHTIGRFGQPIITAEPGPRRLP